MACLCLRLGYVVGHQPLAGFANQFDMLRTTGCLGLVPDADVAAGAATPAAPIERYRVGAPRDPSCLIGTEVLLAGSARALDAVGDMLGLGDPASMPLRLLAVTKALLLLLAFAWIDLRLRAHPGARVVHAWLAALVLADPFNTLYLAGFYTEFAALLTTWLALALPLTWLLRRQAPTLLQTLPWGAILAALALSRFQHALLPLLLLLWLLWLARRLRWPLLPLLAGAALWLLPALALQIGAQTEYRSIADANRWNSFFGAALPAARDPLEFVRDLGLPDDCAELVHTTWYLQRGRDARAECPQAFALSRLRWLAHLAAEPVALMRLVGRGVSLSGQWRPSYLGELAGARGERLPAGRLQLGASLADVVARLPFGWLLAFWSAPLLLPVALVAGRPRRSRERAALSPSTGVTGGSPAALWLWPMLLLAIALGWGASLVGDGYSELARHLHLAANATLVAILLGLLALVRAAFGGTLRGRTLAALLLAAAVLVGGGAFMVGQSLAFGVLEHPAGELASDPLQVSGWALDPRGIVAIEAVWADGSRQRLALRARDELVGIFGAAAPAVGFSGDLAVPAAPVSLLQIEVIPGGGAATVIDRRWIRRQ